MKKSEAVKNFFKKYANVIVLCVAVLVSVLSIVVGILYTRSMTDSLWEQIVTDITEVTAQGGRSFETYVKNDSDSLSSLVNKLKTLDPGDPHNKTDIPEAVSYFRDHVGADGYYSLAIFSGRDPDDDTVSDVYTYITDTTDAGTGSAASAYKDYKENSAGITDEPYYNNYDGRRTLGYYQSFTFEGTNRRGILRKGKLISEINNEYSLSFYNNKGFSYIVKRDGKIIVRPTHRNSNRTGTNLFSILEFDNDSTHESDMLRDALKTGKKGAMLSTEGKEERVISFVPLNSMEELSVSDWYIVSIIPNSAVSQHVESVLQSSVALTVIVVIIIVIFTLFFVVLFYSTKHIKAKEAEVKYREQLFGILAQNTNDVFILLPHGQLQAEYISPNITKVLGVNDDEVKADIRAIGDPDDSEEIGGETDFQRIKHLQDGEMVTYDNTTRTHRITGETRYFRESVYQASVDGVNKDIIVISDRTEEKKAEAVLTEAMETAKAANKAKSAFLSNMSHDIRTPMNAILGFTELIKRDVNDPSKVMQYINKINASGQHLLGLINDVLDMSKIESGKTVLNVQSFNIATFVSEIDAIIRPQTRSKKQTFEIITNNIKSETVLGDKLRINQVIINILSNAVKYTPEGGSITMEITELPRLNENFAHLRFTVADNGLGMSEEYLKVIFNPFTRETTEATTSIQGTGLGMAITKNIVDLLGGTIDVKSKLGEGSTFTVELELRIESVDVNNEFWQEHGISRALIVDDEQMVCDHVTSALQDAGLPADFALNGEDAIKIVQQHHDTDDDYNLILIDLRMPGIDGIETARRLRKIVPPEVAILMLTSYDWGELEETARGAGIDAFLPKPFFVSNLKLNIRTLRKEKLAGENKEGRDDVLKGKHILAAEDNELNAEILSELLDMYEATCDIAANGKIAVEMFNDSKPGQYDLILMDVQMPVMNGYEATRAIRAGDHPAAKSIPIIAMTANAFAEDISAALDAGMNAHVSKPMNIERLEEVYQKILSEKGNG